MNTDFKLKCIIIMFSVSVLLVYGQRSDNLLNKSIAHQTDTEIIKNAVLVLKKSVFRDRAILNINRLVSAEWHQNGGGIRIYSVVKKADEPMDLSINLPFVGPPNYEAYMRGGSKSRIGENFMKQINKKRSKKILLINFIQEDLIVILKFADSSNVILDAYYNDIAENLQFWYQEFDPKNMNPYYVRF